MFSWIKDLIFSFNKKPTSCSLCESENVCKGKFPRAYSKKSKDIIYGNGIMCMNCCDIVFNKPLPYVYEYPYCLIKEESIDHKLKSTMDRLIALNNEYRAVERWARVDWVDRENGCYEVWVHIKRV